MLTQHSILSDKKPQLKITEPISELSDLARLACGENKVATFKQLAMDVQFLEDNKGKTLIINPADMPALSEMEGTYDIKRDTGRLRINFHHPTTDEKNWHETFYIGSSVSKAVGNRELIAVSAAADRKDRLILLPLSYVIGHETRGKPSLVLVEGTEKTPIPGQMLRTEE